MGWIEDAINKESKWTAKGIWYKDKLFISFDNIVELIDAEYQYVTDIYEIEKISEEGAMGAIGALTDIKQTLTGYLKKIIKK